MNRLAGLVAVAILGSAVPADAQFGRPVVVGYVNGFGWGGSPYRLVVPPPVVIVVRPAPPRREELRDPEPPRTDPRETAAAEARVAAAVGNGELLVIKPGKPVACGPERIAPPPVMVGPAVTLDGPKLPADRNARAAFRMAAGRAAFAADEYGRAADQFRAAATTDPLAFFLLAQAHTSRGEYAEAVAAIRNGMRAAPDWPATRFRVTDLYGDRRGRLADHLAALRAAAEARPADPSARFLYAYHLWFAGERGAATTAFRALSPLVKDNALIERFLQEAEGKDL